MPGVHNTSKYKMVGCWVDLEFLADIDRARGELGRSQFVRDALQEKLEASGIEVPREKVIAPDRAGKGGRIKYEIVQNADALNESFDDQKSSINSDTAHKRSTYDPANVPVPPAQAEVERKARAALLREASSAEPARTPKRK
jgi:hypothetical protein